MAISIHIQNNSGNLSKYTGLLIKTVNKIIKKINQKIKVDNVKIVIKESQHPENLKQLGGIGGYCPSGNYVQLDIDIHNQEFIAKLPWLVETVLTHELHHALRNQAGIRIAKSTFLENLFSEGLADNFVLEITGRLPKWIVPITNTNIMLKKAEKDFNKKITERIYKKWFTEGNKKMGIPRYTGYFIGFKMAKNYLKGNPQQSLHSLINIPVSKIKHLYNV